MSQTGNMNKRGHKIAFTGDHSRRTPSSMLAKLGDDDAILKCTTCPVETNHHYKGPETGSEGTIKHKYECTGCGNIQFSDRRV